MSSVADFIKAAESQIGKPYVLGASGTSAFDCSSLVQWAAGVAGQQLPRTTYEQINVGQAVPRAQLQPGDIVFSTWGGEKKPGHVGIYVGNGKVLSAPEPGKTVGYSTLNDTYWSHVDGIRRLPFGGAGGVVGGVVDALIPDGLTGAVRAAADGLRGIAGGVSAVGDLSKKLMWFALPTTQVRLVSFVLGLGFLAVGIRFLVREALR